MKALKYLSARAVIPALVLISLISACGSMTGVSNSVRAPETTPEAASHGFSRAVDAAGYDDIACDEWSLDIPVEAVRRHTLLIYMNGSDLESDTGAGTSDLKELMRSDVDESLVNVVIFTGGANRWHTSEVPSGECAVSVLRGGKLERLGTVGQRDMGNAGTLSSFISFGLSSFPAEKTSLILWDHGGGSIAGFGADENFNMSTLTLRELEYAFERAGLAENRLSLLGFDACLMASVEMAVVAARYAKLLVASEGLEPGDGWNYDVVAHFGDGALTDEELAVLICDYFYGFYGGRSTEELTLSVIRTSEAENVMGALGLLADKCLETLESGGATLLQASRAGAKSFGDGSPVGETGDMIDIADFARELESRFPEMAAQVQNALTRAVLYNVYSSDRELGGLSAYHIYSERRDKARSMEVYSALEMDDMYTAYLAAFAETLFANGRDESMPSKPPVISRVLGENVELYETSKAADGTLYCLPANVNGTLAEALVRMEDGGQLFLGYRRRDGYLIQKGYDEFEDGDTLELLHENGGAWSPGMPYTFRNGGFSAG